MSKIKDAMMSSNLPVTAGDGWDAVPVQSSDLIRGKILRFTTEGFYFLGNSTEPLNGTIANVIDVAVAWVTWVDGKPEHRITLPGQHHPDRGELPEFDKDNWPLGPGGERADPWQDTRYLYLVDPLGEEMTFVTHSWGGRKAVGELRNQIAIFRQAHPTAIPVIRLDKEMMKTRFGPKPKPLFKVIDWKQAGGEPLLQQQIEAPTKKPASVEMDDEIPF
jgi:hypothetical protein